MPSSMVVRQRRPVVDLVSARRQPAGSLGVDSKGMTRAISAMGWMSVAKQDGLIGPAQGRGSPGGALLNWQRMIARRLEQTLAVTTVTWIRAVDCSGLRMPIVSHLIRSSAFGHPRIETRHSGFYCCCCRGQHDHAGSRGRQVLSVLSASALSALSAPFNTLARRWMGAQRRSMLHKS